MLPIWHHRQRRPSHPPSPEAVQEMVPARTVVLEDYSMIHGTNPKQWVKNLFNNSIEWKLTSHARH
jgi:hypothetical protein